MNTEPAVIIGFVEAVVVLATAFGAPISLDEKAAIVGVVSAGLTIAGSFLVRSQVSPTK